MVPSPKTVARDDLAGMAERVRALLAGRRRVFVGIAGAPGAGKSTLARALSEELTAAGLATAWVPMDGFHLADVELDRLGARARKGAIDTFDAHGYLALLRRLETETDHVVYAPGFDRTLEQPLAGAIAVEPGVRVVVTEGNYLLDEDDPWPRVRSALTEVWFCDLNPDVRRERLVARHVRYGKSPADARRWVQEIDEPNAARIERSRGLADLVIG